MEILSVTDMLHQKAQAFYYKCVNKTSRISSIDSTSQRKDRFTNTILDNAIICAWTELESKLLTSA